MHNTTKQSISWQWVFHVTFGDIFVKIMGKNSLKETTDYGWNIYIVFGAMDAQIFSESCCILFLPHPPSVGDSKIEK